MAVVKAQTFLLQSYPNDSIQVPNPPLKVPSVSCNVISQSYPTTLLSIHNSSHKSITKHESYITEHDFDVYSVNEKIKKYTDEGLFEDAITVYINLLHLGIEFAKFRLLPCIIKAFGALYDVKNCRQIHGHVIKSGLLDYTYVVNSLLAMYSKHGAIEDAVKVFDKMSNRDAVSWNTIISCLDQRMDYEGSLKTFKQMIQEFGVCPNRVACLATLSSCSSLQCLIHGQEIHAFTIKNGMNTDEYLISGLIEMYMKCGKVTSTETIFKTVIDNDELVENTVLWNVMISGYVLNGYFSRAFELFKDMLILDIKIDSSTFLSLLILCSQWSNFGIVKQIHSFGLKLGFVDDFRVESALLDTYFKCGNTTDALRIFRGSYNPNLVMWGLVISNLAQCGSSIEAIEVFHDFLLEHGSPDSTIVLAVLRACSSPLIRNREGIEVHGLAVKMGFDHDFYIGTALVDMYAKYGDIESAEKSFKRLTSKDLISWNAMISGYARNEYASKAFNAFRDMQIERVEPNNVTVALILSICGQFSSIMTCKEIHGLVTRHGFLLDTLVTNSLISTYAKCGDMKSSRKVFEKMREKNKISWNSILLGLGMHGKIDEMINFFDKMKNTGIRSDHVTFTAILSACSHAGLVDKGWEYFKSMIEEHKLEPRIEQYTCMVDLLGRAGFLHEAYDLIEAVHLPPDDRIWGSLLGSCKSYGDEKMAKVVANRIFELDSSSIGYRVLLANLYEELGERDEVHKVRSIIKDLKLRKKPGCSWIEVNNNTHVFTSGDKSHDRTEDIYATLENLTTEIMKAGYIH